MEQIQKVEIGQYQVGNKHIDMIRVFVADLPLSCDLVNDRQIRLAKALAESHGAMFFVRPEIQARVEKALAKATTNT